MRVHDLTTAAAKRWTFPGRYRRQRARASRFTQRSEATVARNFGRTLCVALVVALLVTSSPTALPTVVAAAKDAERAAVSWLRTNALSAKLYRGLAYGYLRYRSLTESLDSESRRRPVETPKAAAAVAALVSPAPVVLDAPTNLTVTSATSTSVSLSWTAPAGTVNSYQIERSQSPLGPFPTIGTAVTTSFNDPTVTANNAYLYRVRAVSGGIPSSPSNMALGTAISFTDNPLVSGVTAIKATHVNELRQSVNAVRGIAGLSPASWTDASLPGVPPVFIKAAHVQELRDRLGEALAVLNVPATTYTDPVLATGANGTVVKKAHIEELRQKASRSSSASSGSVGGDVANARLDPLNRTGGGGEDPLSRNFNWSVPLVSLPGRSGLDLGLSLSYNSLVWTRSGSFISFDDDQGFPSPGFRLGFPVIQPLYFNSEVGKWAYLLITPSGGRVELRQVGTSALYEAADSSHLLLDTSTNPMILRSTDGTQLKYEWKVSDFQCTQIKDRNGNFITINYTAFGRLATVVDTLSRTITFNYDGNNTLTSITQTWTVNGSPLTHIWASFAYSNPNLTIQTNFPGLTKVGPQNGSTLKVLKGVTFGDSSRFEFDYTSWGQVSKVSNFATDGHLLNYRSYNLPLDAIAAHTDCPRFTERRDWAKNWNRNESGTEQEAITQFAVPVSTSWTLPGGTPQSGLRAQVTQPDNTYDKLYFPGTVGTTTGWHRGVSSLVETFDSAGALQKQSVTTWTQDNTSVSYPLNPRVIEINAYDPTGNRRRVTTGYTSDTLPNGSSCSLPNDIREYASDATTVLRRKETDYRMNPTADVAYLTRHIIGLVKEQRLNAGVNTLMSRIGFEYDETAIQGTDTPVKHDNTNYSASFVVGRANLTTVKRYDVNTALFVTNTSKYNRAGSVVETTDAASHSVVISYTDAFAANGTTLDPALAFATLGYPTMVTDADGYSTSTRYNYDFGGVTWKQTPLPNTTVNTPGPQQKIVYDSLGRTKRVTNLFNNAYTRFIYGPNYVESFKSVNEGIRDQNNNVADEAHSLQVFDGVGRVIAKAGNHPGSTGGFSAQLVHYDAMGRSIKQSNPTETSISISGLPLLPYAWPAAGDDATAGWLYTRQTYDWKGRPLVTTNTDGTTKEASYSGCGCAGGEVVTLTDEGTLVDIEPGPAVPKKRQQKIYSDVLGRTVKTEVRNWNGFGPFGTNDPEIYSTTVNTYNARDQVTLVRQFQGAGPTDLSDLSCPVGTCQKTTTEYDGHGRLETRHVPEQDAGTNTMWEYNSDDTIKKITDARGATCAYGYNARHQVTSKIHALSGQSTISSSYDYDGAGNRTLMTDGLGSQSYAYDQLSRMESETRTFTGLGTFPLSYGYNLADQLKKITYSTNMTINYRYDTAGRLSEVTGSDNLFLGLSQYASGFVYRAWGGLKQMTDGTNRTSSLRYNSRLQVNHFEISGGVVSQDYDYYNDGRIKFVDHLTDANFDRSYFYDHAARLTIAGSGGAANQQSVDVPYWETFAYDAWGRTTHRFTESWGQDDFLDVASYLDERRTGWGYDADGRLKTIETRQYNYDAAGRQELMTGQVWGGTSYYSTSKASGFDGNGNRVKEVSTDPVFTFTTHYLRSSVLGGTIVQEISNAPQPVAYVYTPDGQLLTRLMGNAAWTHQAPAGIGRIDTTQGGFVRFEFDPVGANVELTAPPPQSHVGGEGDLSNENGTPMDSRFANLANPGAGCLNIDGIEIPCTWLSRGSLSWSSFFLERRSYAVGYRNTGVRWGTPFEAIYDAGRGLVSLSWGGFDPNLQDVNYGEESAIYANSSLTWAAQPPPENSGQKAPCVFNVNLDVTDSALTSEDIAEIKNEMTNVFSAAGQRLVFNDPGAAAHTSGGTYNLTISPRLPQILEDQNADPTFRALLGVTMGITFHSSRSYVFSDQKGHLINRGIVSTYWTAPYLPEGVTLNTRLGTVGAHETGHWFLKALLPDGAHAKDNSLMGDGSPGNRFSKRQAAALAKLCK